MAKKDFLYSQYNQLLLIKKPDIFQQIKIGELAHKLGIKIELSETVKQALSFNNKKREKLPELKLYKKKNKNGKVKTIKWGSTLPTNYKDYIVSRYWENRKEQYYRRHKKICFCCKSKDIIVLHHMVYANLGKEKDEHLLPLCKLCHEEYHRLNGVQMNMIDTTYSFVRSKQKTIG